MDACMNKKQQVSEDQQATKSAMEHAKEHAKEQERVHMAQKYIYVKYALPVRQSSHRNRMNYLFNKLFNNLRKNSVKICIIMFLV